MCIAQILNSKSIQHLNMLFKKNTSLCILFFKNTNLFATDDVKFILVKIVLICKIHIYFFKNYGTLKIYKKYVFGKYDVECRIFSFRYAHGSDAQTREHEELQDGFL
jgi:hypothetical protein